MRGSIVQYVSNLTSVMGYRSDLLGDYLGSATLKNFDS